MSTRHQRRKLTSIRLGAEAAGEVRDPAQIRVLLRMGVIDTEEAIGRFEKAGTVGQLWAGELCVQQAYTAPAKNNKSAWIAKAEHNFQTVVNHRLPTELIEEPQLSAMIHLAQLPNHAAITETGALPTETQARKAYEATVLAAEPIIDSFKHATKAEDKRAVRLAKPIARTAVVLLGQRLALSEPRASTDWLMMQSLYSEHSIQARGSHQTTWNVSMLTMGENGPETTRLFRVVPTLRKDRLANTEPEDIQTISIRPDLQIGLHERLSVATPVAECIREFYHGTPGKLEVRTNQLLNVLGTTIS